MRNLCLFVSLRRAVVHDDAASEPPSQNHVSAPGGWPARKSLSSCAETHDDAASTTCARHTNWGYDTRASEAVASLRPAHRLGQPAPLRQTPEAPPYPLQSRFAWDAARGAGEAPASSLPAKKRSVEAETEWRAQTGGCATQRRSRRGLSGEPTCLPAKRMGYRSGAQSVSFSCEDARSRLETGWSHAAAAVCSIPGARGAKNLARQEASQESPVVRRQAAAQVAREPAGGEPCAEATSAAATPAGVRR